MCNKMLKINERKCCNFLLTVDVNACSSDLDHRLLDIILFAVNILIRYAIAESVVDQTPMKKMRYNVKKVKFCDVSLNVPIVRQKQQLKHG